jgi:hypothetical protein
MNARGATWLVCALVAGACGGSDPDPNPGSGDATTTTATTATTGSEPASYAPCEDPVEGCSDADCRRRDDAAGSWSICVAPCTEDADCPSGIGGNAPIMCDPEGRCVLECVPQILTCPSGTTCIDGDVAQCMWPAP